MKRSRMERSDIGVPFPIIGVFCAMGATGRMEHSDIGVFFPMHRRSLSQILELFRGAKRRK